MPKYSVDDVLDIIRDLTSVEKQDLQSRLSNVLESSDPNSNLLGQKQILHTRDLNFSGSSSNNSIGINQQIGGESSIAQTKTHTSLPKNTDLLEALDILVRLKQDIANSTLLNPVQKATLEVPLKIAEEEAKKLSPNKNIIEQAITSLQKGLEGVVNLAEPVTKIANLVAKAWLGS